MCQNAFSRGIHEKYRNAHETTKYTVVVLKQENVFSSRYFGDNKSSKYTSYILKKKSPPYFEVNMETRFDSEC